MWQVFEYDDLSEDVKYVCAAGSKSDAITAADDRYADLWRERHMSVVAVDFEGKEAIVWGVNPFAGDWDEIYMPEAVWFGPSRQVLASTLVDMAPALREFSEAISGVSLGAWAARRLDN